MEYDWYMDLYCILFFGFFDKLIFKNMKNKNM